MSSHPSQPAHPCVTGIDDDWAALFGERERRFPTENELRIFGSQVVLPMQGEVVRARGHVRLPISRNWMVQFTMVPRRLAGGAGTMPGDIWYEVEYVGSDQTEWFLPPVDAFCVVQSVADPARPFWQPVLNVRVLNLPMEGYLNGTWATWTLDMNWSGILRRVWIPLDRATPPPPPPPPHRQGRGRGRGAGSTERAKGKGKTTYQ